MPKTIRQGATRATKGSAVPTDARTTAEAELLRLEKELSKKLSILKRAQTQAKSGQIGLQDFEAINNEAKLLSKAYSDRKSKLAVAAKETGVLITQDFIDGITKGAQQAAQSNREQDLFLKASALQPAIKAPAAAAKGAAQPFTAEDAATKAARGRQEALAAQRTLTNLQARGVDVTARELRLQELLTKLNQAEAAADEKSLNATIRKIKEEKGLAAIQERNTKKEQARKPNERDEPFKFDPIGRVKQMAGNFKGGDFENLALGAGFPLLFGGGAGSILGSLFGSLIGPGGGFGGQIFGGAVGQQFESLIVSVKNLQDAFDGLTGDFSKLREQGIAASAEAEKQYRDLKGQGKFERGQQACPQSSSIYHWRY